MIYNKSLESLKAIQDDWNTIYDKLMEIARASCLYDDDDEELDAESRLIVGITKWKIVGDMIHVWVIDDGGDGDWYTIQSSYMWMCPVSYLNLEKGVYTAMHAKWREERDKRWREEEDEEEEYEEYQRLKAKFEK